MNLLQTTNTLRILCFCSILGSKNVQEAIYGLPFSLVQSVLTCKEQVRGLSFFHVQSQTLIDQICKKHIIPWRAEILFLVFLLFKAFLRFKLYWQGGTPTRKMPLRSLSGLAMVKNLEPSI